VKGKKLVKILQKTGKGKEEKVVTTQLILTAAEKDAVIDSVKGKNTKKVETAAKEIAQILGLELEYITI